MLSPLPSSSRLECNFQMSKKRKDWSVSGDSTINNPFAALAGIKADLAPGDDIDAVVDEPTGGATSTYSLNTKLVVSRERKGRGGKTATVIKGFAADTDLVALSAVLRKALGTSGNVEDNAIVLGGDIVPRVVAWLESNGAKRVVVSGG